MNKHPYKPQPDDFKDIYFFYNTYEIDSVLFSRTSEKQEPLKAYESKNTHLRAKQLKYHPDKNICKEDTVRGMFEEKQFCSKICVRRMINSLLQRQMVCLVDTTTTSSVTKFKMHEELM